MTYATTVCPECHNPYKPRRWDQVFCKKSCTLRARNRDASRGALILGLAYGWRADRKNGQAYLRGLCRTLAKFIQEDRAAGRKAPRLTAEQKAACGPMPTKRDLVQLPPEGPALAALKALGINLKVTD